LKLSACIFAVLALLCLPRTTSSEDPELGFLSAQLPMYPPLARTAHVVGEVKMAFVIDPSGSVISVEILSGNSMLRKEAEKNVRTWKFQKSVEPSQGQRKDRTTFVYKLNANEPETLAVRMRSYRYVEVEASLVSQVNY